MRRGLVERTLVHRLDGEADLVVLRLDADDLDPDLVVHLHHRSAAGSAEAASAGEREQARPRRKTYRDDVLGLVHARPRQLRHVHEAWAGEGAQTEWNLEALGQRRSRARAAR